MKLLLPFSVGAKRLELSTPCTPCKCASQLRHAPNLICSDGDYLLSKTVAKVLLFFILTKFFLKKNFTEQQRQKTTNYNTERYQFPDNSTKTASPTSPRGDFWPFSTPFLYKMRTSEGKQDFK